MDLVIQSDLIAARTAIHYSDMWRKSQDNPLGMLDLGYRVRLAEGSVSAIKVEPNGSLDSACQILTSQFEKRLDEFYHFLRKKFRSYKL